MELANPRNAGALRTTDTSQSNINQLNDNLASFNPNNELLERCFQAVNKKHFKNTINATIKWEVPTGTVSVRENPINYDLSSEEEHVYQQSVALVKLGKIKEAATQLTPLAESGHKESQLALCHILRKANGDWQKYAEMYNASIRTVKAVPAACYFPESRVIAIHPHLLSRNVPQFVLRYLIFHECCHQVIFSTETEAHPPAFMELEAQAPHRERAIAWLEKEGFPTLRLTK